MNFHLEILINKSRDQVWKSFDNPDNLSKWQLTLKSYEHVSGEHGQVGAVSKLIYNENGREIHMTETISVRDELNEFSGIFETEGGKNTLVNRFKAVDESSTKLSVECEFEFSGAFKFFSHLLKKSIQKRLNEDFQRFKTLVEEGTI